MTVRAYRYAITIEGIPTALAEPGFPASELSAWDDVVETLNGLNESETQLDLGRRRMTGASFSFKARDPEPSRPIRALAAVRQDPAGWLTASSIPATDTQIASVAVNDPSAIPSPFFMGSETLKFTGTSGSNILLVDRAQFSSTAQKHYGSANDGSATEIYSAPRRWTGRKVTLWESVRDEAGAWGSKTSIGVARMSDAPQFDGADVWTFSSTNLAEWYDTRPLIQGLEPVFPKDEVESNRLAETVNLDADSVTRLWNGSTLDNARIIWTLDNGAQWTTPIESSTATSITIDFDKIEIPLRAPLRRDPEGLPVAQTYTWTQAQPALIWEGDPVDITLALLISKLGDGALGTWDVLPGYEPANYDGEISFQTGAGIPQTDIDVSAFKAMRGGPGWRVWLTDRMTVGDLLSEFCQIVGAYWYVNTSGQLTVQRLTERLPPSDSAASITDALWGVSSSDSLGATESTVFHTVRWRGNWDPASERYRVKLNVVDAKARHEAINDDRALDLSSRFVALDVGDSYGLADPSGYRPANPIHRTQLETSLRRIQQYSKRPAAEIVGEVPVTSATGAIVPGAIVDLTNARVPDLEGSTLNAKLALIVGRRRDYDDASYQIRFRLLDNGFLFAPALEVTSVGGGGTTITVSTSTTYGTATPTNQIAVGWTIEDTQGTWSATVASIVSTAVFTISGLSGTVSVGDVVVPKMDGTLSTATSDDGYSMADFCAMVSDVGTAPSGALTRWS